MKTYKVTFETGEYMETVASTFAEAVDTAQWMRPDTDIVTVTRKGDDNA